MSIISFTSNRRGIALFNIVFILIFIGVLAVSGAKMYDSVVKRGKINTSKGGLEDHVKMIVAWAATNGHLPTLAQYPGVFGGTVPLDAWGRPIAYVFDANLTAQATGGLCGRTETALTENGVSTAFALVSQGEDAGFQTSVGGANIAGSGPAIGAVINSPLDLDRTVPLEEMKSKAGCYGPTGGRLSIVNNELPSVCSGSPNYPATLFASGGVGAYTWALTPPPAWLAVNAATGALLPNPAITGTAGTYPVTVRLTDHHTPVANTVQRTYNLNVIACGVDPLQKFREWVYRENVFVYGTKFFFAGNTVSGPNATAVITGGSTDTDFNGGASVTVSTVYVDGSAKLSGSQILGSSTNPGKIYINGNLELVGGAQVYGTEIYVNGTVTTGSGTIGLSNRSSKIYIQNDLNFPNGSLYGEVYVGRDLYMKDGSLYGNLHVYRNIASLDWTPKLQSASYVYYKGSIVSKPAEYTADNARYIHDSTVQPVVLPTMTSGYTMPPLRDPLSWYTDHGYYATKGATEKEFTADRKKIFADEDYISSCGDWMMKPLAYTVTNAIVVSSKNITISAGSCRLTGVLFAPNGKVTFGGSSFEGLVIAKDGFYVTSGGTAVTFKNISNYISDYSEYPF